MPIEKHNNPQEDGNSGRESDRRRATMIRRLFENGEIDIKAFAEDERVRRSFKHRTLPTLSEDLNQIERMLNNDRYKILARQERGLRVAAPSHFAFEQAGYVCDCKPGSSTDAKNRIAKYIVDSFLAEHDILYAGTGTTVFAVGLGLLQAKAKKVETVLTHNLAIVDLWRQQGRLFPRRSNPIGLVILGGRADYDGGDIVSEEEDHSVLGEWQLTKTLMSCTALDIDSGEIFSHRQPKLKKAVLRHARLGKLIIPITRDKIISRASRNTGREAGGPLIPLPPKADVVQVIVTTELSNEERTGLERHGFEVHAVDTGRASAS